MQTKQKGFTLIELLVVIAIIGILASIVLVSFPSANKKAKDSRVKSAVSQVRTVMIYYASNMGNYKNFSSSSPDMATLATEAAKNGYGGVQGLVIATSTVLTNDQSADVCVYVLLNEKDGTTAYCVDSTGVAGVDTLVNITATCLPATLPALGSPKHSCPAGMTD